MKKLLKILYVLIFKSKLFSTLKINFKMLPFNQAIRFPIVVYSKTNFRSLKGRIEIKGRLDFDMISIGRLGYVATTKPVSNWTIEGTIVFWGCIAFFQGSYLLVAKDAVLTFGNEKSSDQFGKTSISFGSNARIMCFESITIGDFSHFAWDVQLMDSSFHYIQNNKEPQSLTKPIVIGDRVWVGNRTTFSRGAVIPSNSIVSSNSMVNKDMSSFGEKSLFVGSPAVMKGDGLYRIWDEQKQAEYDKKFGYSRVHL